VSADFLYLIIAGSRDLHPTPEQIERAVTSNYEIHQLGVVLCGCCSGVDQAGAHWASMHRIEVRHYPVTKKDWDEKGPAAGPIRNAEMLKHADALLLIWDGKSKGSANIKNQALRQMIPVHELVFPR
jgi:hypothetical protein